MIEAQRFEWMGEFVMETDVEIKLTHNIKQKMLVNYLERIEWNEFVFLIAASGTNETAKWVSR